MLVQASEHKKMAQEDINVLKLGRKVGENTREMTTMEDIRKARLARFSSKK